MHGGGIWFRQGTWHALEPVVRQKLDSHSREHFRTEIHEIGVPLGKACGKQGRRQISQPPDNPVFIMPDPMFFGAS